AFVPNSWKKAPSQGPKFHCHSRIACLSCPSTRELPLFHSQRGFMDQLSPASLDGNFPDLDDCRRHPAPGMDVADLHAGLSRPGNILVFLLHLSRLIVVERVRSARRLRPPAHQTTPGADSSPRQGAPSFAARGYLFSTRQTGQGGSLVPRRP